MIQQGLTGHRNIHAGAEQTILGHKLLERWSPGGHLYGACQVLKHINLIYINIPKNASSWAKSQLSTLECKYGNYFENPELVKKPKLIMLRDPIERWISGISWYMTLTFPDLIDQCEKNDVVRSTVMSMVANKIDFDEHTTPQTHFLQGIKFNNTTFIKVESNSNACRKIFSTFFKDKLGITNSFDQSQARHVAAENPIQARWVNFFQSELGTDLSKRLCEYYQHDIDLFNRVKFYDPR
jgi:hypothetical protein